MGFSQAFYPAEPHDLYSFILSSLFYIPIFFALLTNMEVSCII